MSGNANSVSRYLTLAIVLMMASGCAQKGIFAPPRTTDFSADVKVLEDEYLKADLLTAYFAEVDDANKKSIRNKIITGRKSIIDLRFAAFLSKLTSTRAQLNTSLDVMKTGVDLAITVTGGAQLKSILGATSAGLTGVQGSVFKNFFYEQTIPALAATMESSRREAALPIIDGLTKSDSAYPLATAMGNLEAYYHAGTIPGALVAVQKNAAQQAQDADDEAEKFRIVRDDAFDVALKPRIEKLRLALLALDDDTAKALVSNLPVDSAPGKAAIKTAFGDSSLTDTGDKARGALVTYIQFMTWSEKNVSAFEKSLAQ